MSATERIRYWADWIVKNLAALLTIAGLLGFSVYSQTESSSKDTAMTAMDAKMTELAEQVYVKEQKKAPRKTKTVVIRKGCNKCLTEIKALKRKYHPE